MLCRSHFCNPLQLPSTRQPVVWSTKCSRNCKPNLVRLRLHVMHLCSFFVSMARTHHEHIKLQQSQIRRVCGLSGLRKIFRDFRKTRRQQGGYSCSALHTLCALILLSLILLFLYLFVLWFWAAPEDILRFDVWSSAVQGTRLKSLH